MRRPAKLGVLGILGVATLLAAGCVPVVDAVHNVPIPGEVDWAIVDDGVIVDQGGGPAMITGGTPYVRVQGRNVTTYTIIPGPGWVGEPGQWTYKLTWNEPLAPIVGEVSPYPHPDRVVETATLTTGTAVHEFGTTDLWWQHFPAANASHFPYDEPGCPNNKGLEFPFVTVPFTGDPTMEFALTMRICEGTEAGPGPPIGG